ANAMATQARRRPNRPPLRVRLVLRGRHVFHAEFQSQHQRAQLHVPSCAQALHGYASTRRHCIDAAAQPATMNPRSAIALTAAGSALAPTTCTEVSDARSWYDTYISGLNALSTTNRL